VTSEQGMTEKATVFSEAVDDLCRHTHLRVHESSDLIRYLMDHGVEDPRPAVNAISQLIASCKWGSGEVIAMYLLQTTQVLSETLRSYGHVVQPSTNHEQQHDITTE
jgi:hypothetical protein